MEDEKKTKERLRELKVKRLQSARIEKRVSPDSTHMEEELLQQAHKLAERVKELDCLYGISNLIETPGISIEVILRGTVELLPPAWQYPSLACAHIILQDQTYKTANFQESAWRLASDIKVQGELIGRVEVCYLQEPPFNGHEPFLSEEVKLLNDVAKRLSRVIERKQTEEALKESQLNIRNMAEQLEDVLFATDDSGFITFVSPSVLQMFGWKPEEMVGRSFIEFLLESEIPGAVAKFKDGLASGRKTKHTSFVMKRKDESTFQGEVNSSVIWKYKRTAGKVGIIRDITERKRAEEALKESEERYRSQVEAINDVAYAINSGGEFTYISPVVRNLLGYDPDEITGRNLLEFVHQDDHDLLKRKFSELREGVVSPDHYRMIGKDGNIKWVRALTSPIIEVDSFAGGRGVIIDMTERIQAEEALRRTEENFRRSLNDSPLGIRIVTAEGKTIYANRSILGIYGYDSVEELNTTPLQNRYTPESYAEFLIRAEKRRQGIDVPSEYSIDIIRKNGEVRHLLVFRKGIMWDDERQYQVIYQDITEQKRAQEAFRKSEKRYHKLFESMTSGFALHEIILDEGGKPSDYRFLDVNPAFEKLTGWKAADLVGRTVLDVLPDTKLFWTETYGRIAATGEPFHFENYSKILDKYFDVFVYKPEPGRYASMFQDITQRKRSEEEKRILEERLQHAEKMEAIGTLAGGIAHDFNNLLMGIQGHASLTLQDLDPSNPHYERLKRIEEQVRSGADLTGQLLGFARGGRYDVKPADMNDILEKVSSMLWRTKKEISIHRKYGKKLWSVEVDRGQMEQVFMNLYVNALQAMPEGGEICLKTENVLLDNEQALICLIPQGKYVKITVSDTGTGMDEKTRERIFDPFFTTKEMGRGTGLGLATVYGIIKGHKGMIHVDSEPDHGTTFTIHLPASEKEVVKEKTVTGTIARGTETILLVDDEKMVLEVSKELLESMGYRVYAAGSGQEAIAVYMEKRSEIDMVILDMIMPGISGGETFDRLREINHDIKVLLSSGYSIEGQAQEIMDRGCNGFLQKPFRLTNLSRKVREMLD